MMLSVPGAHNLKSFVAAPKTLSEFSAETYKFADAVLDSLLVTNHLVPTQWASLRRQPAHSRELHLLWWVFISAWEDLGSTDNPVRAEAVRFFTIPDAGEPISLRFLCDAFDLDLGAVQTMARVRIETGLE